MLLVSMKKLFLMIALTAIGATAQDTNKPAEKRPQNPTEKRSQNPIIAALDANHDGEIDAAEIANAPAALRKLDKNGDGKISRAEMRAERKADQAGDSTAKKKKKKNSE
jgi:Ca2+-binding EF-hand superfamily protein